MIDAETFSRTWTQLCDRWGRAFQADEARLYRAFLNHAGLDTTTFLRASSALWATREYFPRPADFLLVERADAWQNAVQAVEAHSPPTSHGWDHLAQGSRARQAVVYLGGLETLKTIHQRDPLRARDRFSEAYDAVVLELAASTPMVARKDDQRALTAGDVS